MCRSPHLRDDPCASKLTAFHAWSAGVRGQHLCCLQDRLVLHVLPCVLRRLGNERSHCGLASVRLRLRLSTSLEGCRRRVGGAAQAGSCRACMPAKWPCALGADDTGWARSHAPEPRTPTSQAHLIVANAASATLQHTPAKQALTCGTVASSLKSIARCTHLEEARGPQLAAVASPRRCQHRRVPPRSSADSPSESRLGSSRAALMHDRRCKPRHVGLMRCHEPSAQALRAGSLLLEPPFHARSATRCLEARHLAQQMHSTT